MDTALELVKHNIGIAILPTPYVKNLKDSHIMYNELSDYEYLKNDMNFIYLKNRFLPSAVHEYINSVINLKYHD